MNQDLLRQYAAFAVRVGVNPQKGQTLIITAPIEGAAFVRLCAQEAVSYTHLDVYKRQVFGSGIA